MSMRGMLGGITVEVVFLTVLWVEVETELEVEDLDKA